MTPPRLDVSLRVDIPSPLKGAHPAAWQSQFRGCPGMGCSAAIGPALVAAFRTVRAARSAVDN